MESKHKMCLEESLAKTESDAEAALKAASTAVRALKKVRDAAKVGNLPDLRKLLDASEKAVASLKGEVEQTKLGWDFDAEYYLSSGGYQVEVQQKARELGVRMSELGERLYCYPSLISVLPGDKAVIIDKAREKRLRPSVLVQHLKSLQNRPVRFKSEAFLESLYDAYKIAVEKRRKEAGTQIALAEIYALLTLLPGQSREYSRQEFARDLYLLDESGNSATRRGLTVNLHPARGSEADSRIFSIITKDGRVKQYYGISFAQS